MSSTADDIAIAGDSTESRVVELLENAIASVNESEKVSFLNQAQEFIIYQDILDNFLDEILGFQSDKFSDVRKFVAGFIEATCKKEPDSFPKVIVNLNMMLTDEVPNVLKKSIQVCTQLYKVFLLWLSKTKITDEIESTWEVWSQIKNYIFTLIDTTENDGVRTQCIKFIENVIMCQTKRDTFTTDEFSLDQIITIDNKLIDPEALEEEAIQLFEQLVSFQAKIHISSVNLMATMQSLSLLARQRSRLFFNKVVFAFETLSTNLPPTLAKSQVNSVNKQLKQLFLLLLKHPFLYSTKLQPKISDLLLDLGTSQSEINRCMQDVRKRGIKIDQSTPVETKRVKLEPEDEESDMGNGSSVSEVPSFNIDSCLYDISKKFSRHDAMKASEITTKDLNRRLTNINVVSEIVLASLHMLPSKMDDRLRTVLSDSVNVFQHNEAANQLAWMLTAMGIGPGVDEVVSKYTNMFANLNRIKMDPDINKKISSLIKKCIAKEVKRQEIYQNKVKLTYSGKSMQATTKIKQFNLLDITKPLEVKDKLKHIENSIVRILTEDKNGHFSAKQFETRHKILGKFLSDFSNFDSLKSMIRDYIFKDIRNRYDILLHMLYLEYVAGKQNFSLDYYSSCLCWAIQNIINCCDVRDRDFFLNKFGHESPYLTENALLLLKKFILNKSGDHQECASSGITLAKSLVEKRVKHRLCTVEMLLQVCMEASSDDVSKLALESIKHIYQDQRLSMREFIENFANKNLKMLLKDAPEGNLCGLERSSWDDETIMRCLSLYLLLLPLNHKFLHQLPPVYVGSNRHIQRVINRAIQGPIEAIDNNSPEILLLVETCPKGADPLISRVIRILADKETPSAELVARVKALYHRSVDDVRFLFPVLNRFNKKEIIALLPKLIKQNPNIVKEIFNRLLATHVDSSSVPTSPISPADLLIALHMVDESKCDLKTIMKATNLCFEEKNLFTAEVLAVVMQNLVDQNPLPTLLMRTVIQTLTIYPRLITFVMSNILHKLIVKQVWTQKMVWEGFIKCCQRTMPHSFTVLLQLHPTQLKSVFDACPEIKPALAAHLPKLSEQQMAHISQSLRDLILSPNEKI